ncbi:unnamed protein product, partial [Allacma fusca]
MPEISSKLSYSNQIKPDSNFRTGNSFFDIFLFGEQHSYEKHLAKIDEKFALSNLTCSVHEVLRGRNDSEF